MVNLSLALYFPRAAWASYWLSAVMFAIKLATFYLDTVKLGKPISPAVICSAVSHNEYTFEAAWLCTLVCH